MTLSDRTRRRLAATGCPVAFDARTRRLHATDASIYQIEPAGVAFPRSAVEASRLLETAAAENVPIIPRGAGTGLAGGAIGDGLVVDFARHLKSISPPDLERNTIRVGAGVVLDELNAFLAPHGHRFGPDVATSSRATIGGMIANDSSGARAPRYGTTARHVVALELILADGRLVRTDRPDRFWTENAARVDRMIRAAAGHIRKQWPESLPKRLPGLGFARYLDGPGRLEDLIPGSEGTLAGITAAEIRIVPRPARSALALFFFRSIPDAMEAAVDLLRFEPSAVEHIDRILFDQTRGQPPFRRARDLLRLDEFPCESILIMECTTDDPREDPLEPVRSLCLGDRRLFLDDPADSALVWELRKAGLSLITGRAGPAKPTTGIEDAAVHPRDLPDYVRDLRQALNALGLEACLYGHAASGLLHVRPVLDLHTGKDRLRFRAIAGEVSSLVRRYRGALAAEHGVGMARAEFMPEHLGPEIIALTRDVQLVWDPSRRMNPGKILPGRFRIDENLRQGPDNPVDAPPDFPAALAYARRDHGLVANLEQCNGCGGCRKAAPTMCPTFPPTRDEALTTRGRANIIRAALEERRPLDDPDLRRALETCLSCKACAVECPSNVDLSLLKADLLHARHQRHGLPLSARVLSAVHQLGRIGTRLPAVANAALRLPPVRRSLELVLGLDARRPLPPFARKPWNPAEVPPACTAPRGASRGAVVLWADCFARFHEPAIGTAAVRVLESAGFSVHFIPDQGCCGRPAFSQGHLDRARREALSAVRSLAETPEAPVLFLEPSCHSMLAHDSIELRVPEAGNTAQRSWIFEDWFSRHVGPEDFPTTRPVDGQRSPVFVHAHCHARATGDPAATHSRLATLLDTEFQVLPSSCCGMAGAFGAMNTTYDLSIQIGSSLAALLDGVPDDAPVLASGTSCRHQIRHLTSRHPMHPAEFLERGWVKGSDVRSPRGL